MKVPNKPESHLPGVAIGIHLFSHRAEANAPHIQIQP